MTHRILANASVDVLEGHPEAKNGNSVFKVNVEGLPPFDYRRTYVIAKSEESQAAMEGLRRFTEEMESLQ